MADIRKYFTKKKIIYEEEEEEEEEKPQVKEEEVKKQIDDREVCKYGSKCYQRNTKHLEKYRHSPKREAEVSDESSNESKKRRINESADVKTPDDDTASEDDAETQLTKKENNKSEDEADDDNDDDDEEEEDDDPIPESPIDVKENIKQKFLVEMPEDFYSFWKFCEQNCSGIVKSTFRDRLKRLLNLRLVGPFDVLSGKLKDVKNAKLSAYLRHWRYYYDPPEFQTVLAGDDKSQFHVGYFRDDPKELPAFVASNSASVNCTFKNLGPNLFAALYSHVDNLVKESKSKKDDVERLREFQSDIKKWTTKHKISLEPKPSSLQERERKVVAKGFHAVGIVVPYDKKTEVGYRPLPESNANLKKLFQRIADSKTEADRDKHKSGLWQIVTLVQFANDECDYGMGLEFGLAMFSFGGSTFHNTVKGVLPLAYELLKRPQYSKIVKAHLKDRRKHGNLSIA